ncbi:MFS transporter [Actinocorallia sp. API 0066]|uniref:MFS transporter n=1 Tax=Actinocorallia sp. API 0066 TaxID=2896846 RepID=UPI001E616656|nr:MFS transporter [Actinocorallia sp. API 0066]MCD0449327.1 MFS transporter [Actinocorallia sp. API 0066]
MATQAALDPAPASPRRRLLALVLGQGLALTGDYALLVALAWTAVQHGGAGAITLLSLAAAVPRALALIFGGAFADLHGPRFVLLRTTSARTVLLAGGAVTLALTDTFWPLVLIAAVEGALLGLGSPSFGSLLPELAEGDDLARANSLYSTVLRLSPIVGTPFGAILIGAGHVWHALALVSLTCAVSFGTLVYVTRGFPKPPPQQGESLLRRSGDGVRLLAGNARLRWLFVCAFCLDMSFGWPVEVALPLLVEDRGWGVQTIGIAVAAFSAGALLTGLAGAMYAHRIPLWIRLVASGVGIAIGIAAMALMPTVLALSAVGFAVGVLSGFNGPAIVTLYQQAAPRSRMGAAMSTLSLAGIATAPASVAVFGGLSLVLGLTTTWLVCGAVALIGPVAAVLALRSPVQADEPPTDTAADTAEPDDGTAPTAPENAREMEKVR